MDDHNFYTSINSRFIGNPPVYNGERNPRIITSWILSFERFARLAQVPKEVMVELSGTYLVGQALHWFNDLGNSVQQMDWLEFREHLLQRFTDPTHVEGVLMKWDNLKPVTSVEAYIQEFHELRALVPQKFRTEDSDMRKFIKGLKFKTQFEVESRNPIDLEDAELKAFKFDQLFSHRNLMHRFPNNRGPQGGRKGFNNSWFNTNNGSNQFNYPTQQSSKSISPGVPMEVDNVQGKIKSKASNQSIKNKTCFKCGERGHFASNCLKGQHQ